MTLAHIVGLAGALLGAALSWYAARRRDVPGAAAFAVMLGAAAVVSAESVVYLLAGDPAQRAALVWIVNVAYLALPVAWVLFAWQYTTHHRSVSPRAVALLAAIPLLMVAFTWTNGLHGLVGRWQVVPGAGGAAEWQFTRGALQAVRHWTQTIYGNGLLVVGSFLILRLLLHYKAEHLYGRQALALLAGVVVPVVLNQGHNLFGFDPIPGVNLSAPGIVLGGLCLAYGIFQHGLLDILPAAHNAIINALVDGIVVLDRDGRVVELNPAAESILGHSSAGIVGEQAESVLWTDHPELVRHYTDMTETRVEITLGEGDSLRYFDVKISPLKDRKNHLTGRVLTLHDVTEHKVEHAQLEAALEEVRRTHEALEREHAELIALKRPATAN